MQGAHRALHLVIATALLKASCVTPHDVTAFCSSVRQMHQQCDRYEGEPIGIPTSMRGKAGPRGEKGEKGSPAIVNYRKIESMVQEEFEELEYFAPADCGQVTPSNFLSGSKTSGVYSLFVGEKRIEAYCDLQTDGGGWTIIQRRMDGSVDFYLGRNDYVNGFGNTSGEYWIGLENIHNIVAGKHFEMRIDLEDWTGVKKFAKYSYFSIDSHDEDYRLNISGYSGTAGNSMAGHTGNKFTTKDHDVDRSSGNCAITFKGAWWYESCHSSNLNGLYHGGRHESYADGVNWSSWKGQYYSLKFTEMKIRPSV